LRNQWNNAHAHISTWPFPGEPGNCVAHLSSDVHLTGPKLEL